MVSFHIQAHLNAFLQILEYYSQSVYIDCFTLLVYSVFRLVECAGCICARFALQQAPKKEVGRRDQEIWVAKIFFDIILSLKYFQFLACWHLKCDMLHRLVGNTR